MSSKKDSFEVISFYRFITVEDKKRFKIKLDKYFNEKLVKGTILVSNEGINGTLSGNSEDVNKAINLIKKYLKIRNLTLNQSKTNFLPFNKMKVRLKKEIVSLGKGNLNKEIKSNKYVDSKEWVSILKDKNIKVIDVRNKYEIDVGRFRNSIDPKLNNFREFPAKFNKLKINKKDKIAMYCTGGIRCEKASSYLASRGYKNITQLRGGILSYLKKSNQLTNDNWTGECFVFDDRVTINKKLVKGRYQQCYGCRKPLSKKELHSKYYRKGVHCQYCINIRSNFQKKKSITRQAQIEQALIEKTPNAFIKYK